LIIAHLIDSFHRFSHSPELSPQDGRPARGSGQDASPHDYERNETLLLFILRRSVP
jgi:hypothetical protein